MKLTTIPEIMTAIDQLAADLLKVSIQLDAAKTKIAAKNPSQAAHAVLANLQRVTHDAALVMHDAKRRSGGRTHLSPEHLPRCV